MKKLKDWMSLHFREFCLVTMGVMFLLLFGWTGVEKLSLETAARKVVLLTPGNGMHGSTGYTAGNMRIVKRGDRLDVLAATPYIKLQKGYYRALVNYRSDQRVNYDVAVDMGRNIIASGHLSRTGKHFRTGKIDFAVNESLNNRIVEVRLWYSGQEKVEVKEAQISRINTPYVEGFRLPVLLLILPILILLLGVVLWGLSFGQQERLQVWSVGLVTLSFGFVLLPTVYEIFLFIAVLLVTIGWLKTKELPVFQITDLVLLIFIGFTAVSVFFSSDVPRSLEGTLVFVLYFWIYQVFKSIHWNSRESDFFVWFTAIGLGGWSAFSLFHGFVLDHFLILSLFGKSLVSFEANQHHEILISFFQYGSMGAYLMVLGSVPLLERLISRHKKIVWIEKGMLLFSLIFIFLAVYMAGGRGALLFLVILMGTLIVANRYWRLLAILGILMLGIVLVPNDKIKNTMENLTNPSQIVNLGGRLEQYKEALFLFKRSPLTGVGLLQFSPNYKKDKPVVYHNDPVEFVHGLYLGLLCETGILGLGSFLVFLVLLGVGWTRRWIKGELHVGLSQGMGVLLGLILISFFDALFYNVPLGILIWIYFGLAENRFLSDWQY